MPRPVKIPSGSPYPGHRLGPHQPSTERPVLNSIRLNQRHTKKLKTSQKENTKCILLSHRTMNIEMYP